MSRTTAFGAALSCLLLAQPLRSNAAPGDLDPAFGGFGIGGSIAELGMDATDMAIDAEGRLVIVGNANGTMRIQRRSGTRFLTVEQRDIVVAPEQDAAFANALALAPDGKIVIGGKVTVGGSDDFAVVRLNPDLTPDAGFAEDGAQSSDFHDQDDEVYDVVVQSDLKIVAVGQAVDDSITGTDIQWAAERFNNDGTLDRGFDGDGRWTFRDADVNTRASAVALQSDGKIVIAGTICTGLPLCDDDFGIVRLNSNGSTDGGFADEGLLDVGFGDDEDANVLALMADGRIVAAGGEIGGPLEIIRVMTDGRLDPGFGNNGRLVDAAASAATDVLVQPDGKVVVSAGGLRRYTADGELDASLGGTGAVPGVSGALAVQADAALIAVGGRRATRLRWDGTPDAGGIIDLVFDPTATISRASGLAVQGDGKLLAVGEVYHPNIDVRSSYSVGLARFGRDRHGLDSGFGNDIPPSGRTLYGVAAEDQNVQAMALQADGKAVVVGRYSTLLTGSSVLVGRFNADGTPDASCGGTGLTHLVIGDVDGTGSSSDSGGAVAVGADGKLYVGGTVQKGQGYDYGLARLTSDCTLDRADGVQLEDYRFAFDLGGYENLAGIALQGSKVVLAGSSGDDVALIRFGLDRTGTRMTRDNSFGSSGQATLSTGFETRVAGLGRQSDGKLIVGGWVNRSTSSQLEADFFVARFTADGVLDDSFGDGGMRLADLGPFDAAAAVTVRSDDTIAVAGCTNEPSRIAVAQFTAAGALDSGFSGDGLLAMRLGPDGNDCAAAVAFVGPDRLAIGGSMQAFGDAQFSLASFETTSVPIIDACVGDCDGDGAVTVNELVRMVSIALGVADLSVCPAADSGGDGQVTIDELLAAVNAALSGCPPSG